MRKPAALFCGLLLTASLSGCGSLSEDEAPADGVLATFVSDPVKNVNGKVFADNAGADWLKHIEKVDDGSFDGIEITTSLTFSKENQYVAVDVCEAFTAAMETPGMVQVTGTAPDIQMDGSDAGKDAKLAVNLPGGFWSDVKATETCVRDANFMDAIDEPVAPFPDDTPALVMPDLGGVGLDAADNNMAKRGFKTYKTFDIVDATGAERVPSDFWNWIIVEQDPRPGTALENRESVKVFVRKRSE